MTEDKKRRISDPKVGVSVCFTSGRNISTAGDEINFLPTSHRDDVLAIAVVGVSYKKVGILTQKSHLV